MPDDDKATLRDQLAFAVLSGLIAKGDNRDRLEQLEEAYREADAYLEDRGTLMDREAAAEKGRKDEALRAKLEERFPGVPLEEAKKLQSKANAEALASAMKPRRTR